MNIILMIGGKKKKKKTQMVGGIHKTDCVDNDLGKVTAATNPLIITGLKNPETACKGAFVL